ncbi:MAG: hypothetical protein JSS94_10855 [Bacteroidetes bacterium]|nr:hypothetical protein [Bacteroidota bacterium]
MNTELKNWAKEVVLKCNPIAKDYKLDYYAFQKPCNLDYETLILALNPYQNCTFPIQKTNEDVNITMTAEKLLSGNCAWDDYKTKGKIYTQLFKMKFIDDLQLQFNYMNYVYFSSRQFKDVNRLKEVDLLSICRDFTLKFLKILQPKRIILLGTDSGIDQFDTEQEVLLEKDGKRLIIKGKINGVELYAIPHPSWLSDDALAAIDINLREIFSGQKQSFFNFSTTKNLLNRENIDCQLKELNPDTKSGSFTDITINGIDDEKILIRINYKQRLVGIRNIDSKSYINLKHHDFYKKFFTNIICEKQQSWAFQRKFPSHFFADINDITKEIFDLEKGIKNYKK